MLLDLAKLIHLKFKEIRGPDEILKVTHQPQYLLFGRSYNMFNQDREDKQEEYSQFQQFVEFNSQFGYIWNDSDSNGDDLESMLLQLSRINGTIGIDFNNLRDPTFIYTRFKVVGQRAEFEALDGHCLLTGKVAFMKFDYDETGIRPPKVFIGFAPDNDFVGEADEYCRFGDRVFSMGQYVKRKYQLYEECPGLGEDFFDCRDWIVITHIFSLLPEYLI